MTTRAHSSTLIPLPRPIKFFVCSVVVAAPVVDAKGPKYVTLYDAARKQESNMDERKAHYLLSLHIEFISQVK